MLIARYAKIAMSLALAAFCLLVAFDNVTDYGTNYLFVQRVLSMDTTFAGNALMYRSITNPVLLFCTAHIAFVRIRELRIVTFGAFTTTWPPMSRPSITAPAVPIVNPPLGVSVVPAGTPVFDASG